MQLRKESRGQGSNPGKPDFFRLSFRNCISCVNNCEDLLYIYFIQHYSTILNATLLCNVEQGGQTNSLLLITPENIEKVESILQNIIAQGGTPENKRKVGKIVKHH